MKFTVLDHGYVELIEAWGGGRNGGAMAHSGDGEGAKLTWTEDNEVGIIEAARQSTQGSFRGWEQDVGLLKFLASHHHDSPFEFSGMVIEVQAPIFVFREWHRHRTQSYNEMSARYAPLPDLNYLPTAERMLWSSTANKQAGTIKGAAELDGDTAQDARNAIRRVYELAQKEYEHMLALGVPKEIARVVLPVGRYSRMRAAANLRNWLGFLKLRLDESAQWEIRQYAKAVSDIAATIFPQTMSVIGL